MGSFENFKQKSAEKKEKMKESLRGREYKREIDPRFWTPTKEKDGTTSAIIRFVGLKDHDELNFINTYHYVFKNPHTNKWYWENSLRTIGEIDPVAKYNAAKWAAGEKGECSRRRQGGNNTTNIYVIKDTANPEAEGKVFLFNFGGYIKKLIAKAAEGLKEGDEVIEEGFDPFDLWEGANLLIKGEYKERGAIESEDGEKKRLYTYENSKFLSQTALLGGDDEKLKKNVFDQMHNIQEFIDPANFKSYDELADRFCFVEGIERDHFDEVVEEFESGKKKLPKKDEDEVVEEFESGKKKLPKKDEDEVEDAPKEKPSKKSKKAPKEEPTEETSVDSLDDFDDSELEELMNLE